MGVYGPNLDSERSYCGRNWQASTLYGMSHGVGVGISTTLDSRVNVQVFLLYIFDLDLLHIPLVGDVLTWSSSRVSRDWIVSLFPPPRRLSSLSYVKRECLGCVRIISLSCWIVVTSMWARGTSNLKIRV